MLIRNIEDLRDKLSKAKEAGTVALDTETSSLLYYELEMIGFSFSYAEGEDYYVPLRHTEGGNLPEPEVIQELQSLFNTSGLTIVMHNAKFDLMVFRKYNIEPAPDVKIEDSMLEAWLVDENRHKFSLKSLSNEEFNSNQTTFEELTEGGYSIAEVDVEDAGEYACADTKYTLMLHRKYRPMLAKQDLEQAYNRIEIPFMRVLSSMAQEGIQIDDVLRQQMIAEAERKSSMARDEVFEIIGYKVNLNSPKQVGKALFEELGLPIVGRTAKGEPSVSEEVLSELESRGFSIASKIREYRWYTKMNGTFLKNLEPQFDGRIFPGFHQTGTVTGRLSSSGPNMQNYPLEDKLGVRACIIPYPGDVMLVADYSQMELVLTAHYTQDPKMMSAYIEGRDIHQQTADLVGCDRRAAKTVNFGILYGLSAPHLAVQLGVSKEDAQDIIDGWYNAYPKVKDFKLWVEGYVQKYGYVRTLSGRKRRLPDVHSSDWKKKGYALRQSLNAIIQGSCADIMKYAMVKVAEKYHQKPPCRMISTVHDELIASVSPEQAEDVLVEVKNILEKSITLRVPITADVHIARNWWWGKMEDDIAEGKAKVPRLLQSQIPIELRDTMVKHLEV